MCQSSSILRMLGMRLGYYHDDAMVCWAIDSIMDFVEDLQTKFCRIYLTVMENEVLTEREGDMWLENYWDKLIPVLEKRLAEHGQ